MAGRNPKILTAGGEASMEHEECCMGENSAKKLKQLWFNRNRPLLCVEALRFGSGGLVAQ